nr:hypothetical protein [Tanacetum cinerariifolium]
VVGYKDDPNKDFESPKEDYLSEILAKRGDVSPSSIKRLQISDFCAQNHFFQQLSVLNKLIPKQIMTMEEKYLRHCLELIHTSAMTANSWPISSSRVVGGRNGGRDALFLFSSGNENFVMSSSVDPIVGSITGSRTMINLLNSHLLRQLGTSHDDISNRNTGALEVRESICVDSSHDIQKKRVLPEDQIFGCSPVHKRLVSHSSTYSTFSDPSTSSSSSSSSSSGYCQGMLHCSWNYGFPRYVFSVEDQREVYTTNLSKADSIRDDSCDYIYSFYSRAGKRENVIHDEESEPIGKMRVSTSFTVCPQGTDIMETQYILYATGEHSEGGTHTPNQTVKKSKGLSKKVSNIFKGNHIRRRTSSKFDGSVAIQDTSLELNEEGNLFHDSSFPSNTELAAIVVKDHIPDSQKKVEVGGWGLKFLKEGVHGGPRTKNGGPSSLVERWSSGGSCDCGGWDIGCPLTILNAGPNNKDVLYQAGVFGKSHSFELYTQGCKQSMPVIEVTNVHDGLYYIHYQSSVSALQSLSIAVAIIHSHSPTLKPKLLLVEDGCCKYTWNEIPMLHSAFVDSNRSLLLFVVLKDLSCGRFWFGITLSTNDIKLTTCSS